MNDKLRPTLWRTARALANENRLRFLKAVFESKGSKGVSALAEELGIAVSTASIYLRALNARGLVDVKRRASYVYYGCGKDRSLPEAQRLQTAFARLFAQKDLSDDWPSRMVPVLKAYGNLRRISLVRLVASEGPLAFGALSLVAYMPETSLLRHLSVLLGAGVLALDAQRRYVVARPRDPVGQALLTITTSDS